jgi:arsenate reductase
MTGENAKNSQVDTGKVLFVCHPRCTTCKRARAWLDEHGVAYTERSIIDEPPTQEELERWQAAAGVPVRKLFNTSGQLYREQGIKAQLDAGMSDEDARALLATSGMLVKRPVLVTPAGAAFGFKDATYAALLGV